MARSRCSGSRREDALADSAPRTFSQTTNAGWRMRIASRISTQRFDLEPSVIPASLPAVDTSWQGDPPPMMWTPGTLAQSTLVMSPRFGTPG